MRSADTVMTTGMPAPRSLREAWVALAGLSAVFLFEMLDMSILNVALPTIGRELAASTTALQWVTGAYAVVFGGLMLAFGAIADRFGRRRLMLIGLVLLGTASLATAFVATAEQLIAVRVAMGVAAAMTTPGSMALAFRLFAQDDCRAGQPPLSPVFVRHFLPSLEKRLRHETHGNERSLAVRGLQRNSPKFAAECGVGGKSGEV